MSRYVNPVPQYLDGAGNPVVNGKLFIYESEQNVLKSSFADQQQTIPNTNPVILDSAGRTPNTFYTGTARVVLQDSSGLQIFERDPVGGENAFSDFGQWLNYITYDVNDIVELSNQFYLSKTIANQGNDPSVSPGSNANWTLVDFLGLFNTSTTYPVGAIVFTSNGKLFASVVSDNLNNDPTTDVDGDFWTSSANIPIRKTTVGLIASSEIFATGVIIESSGYAASADGGAGSWKQNGFVGQTPSQSPLQLNAALLNDAAGNQWALIENGPVSALALGPGATAAIAASSTFGTAATATVTTSSADSTADRLLKVGDFGIGGPNTLAASTNLDAVLVSGTYGVNSATITNRPTGAALGSLQVFNYSTPSVPRISQLYYSLTSNVYVRSNAGAGFGAWVEIFTSGNDGGITYGSNANGEFTKFPDGTLICRQFILSSTSGEVTWTYPHAFIAIPKQTATPIITSLIALSPRYASHGLTGSTLSVLDASSSRISSTVAITATGRWK
jgi:hypothetical protein